jgi:hypothetical protein
LLLSAFLNIKLISMFTLCYSMNTALASLGKNLVLVFLVILSGLNFFYGWFTFKDLLGIQVLAGLLYIFLSCYEYTNANYQAQLPIKRYAYFPYRFFVFSVFKIGAYLFFTIMLFSAGSRIQYLYPICIIVAITEVIVTGLRYYKQLCFISIYANYLFLSQKGLSKVFATEITMVEFRHDILYLIKKDKSTLVIKLEEVENRIVFLQNLKEWLVRNAVQISDESKLKLAF